MGKSVSGKLSLSQLRAVEAVARSGSFSAAAKELGISQPSVSNHILALEQKYKTKLLRKNGYSALPSPALEALLPRIRAVLALAGDLERDLESRGDLAKGDIRIGYSTFQIAIPIISEFMAGHPEIKIEARAMASQDALGLLADGMIDVCFMTGREMPPGTSGLTLLECPIVLAVMPDHPLAAKGSASWKDVAALQLVQRERSSGTRRIFEAAATIAGIRPQTRLALGSWGSISTLVRSGAGVGVCLEAEIEPEDVFVPVRINDPGLVARHFVVCQPEMASVAAVSAFMAAAADHQSGSSQRTGKVTL